MDEDGILKLVFLVEANTGRKAVVPLVEGVHWEGFLARVRARLGLPVGHAVHLHDDAGLSIDSMDKLLEADESATLQISFVAAAAAELSASSGSAAATSRRPVAAAQAAAQTPGAPPNRADECRVDIGASPGVRGPCVEDGDLKYRKKRGGKTSRRKLLGAAIVLVACVGFVGAVLAMASA
jgi:hypothetical protein